MNSPRRPRIPAVPRGLWAVLALAVALGVAGCTGGDDPADDVRTAGSPTKRGPPRPSGEFSTKDERIVGVTSAKTRLDDEESQRTTSGDVPAYVEIEAASVEGTVDGVVMTMELAGRLPDRMPGPATRLRVTFLVTPAELKNYTFVAEATTKGWQAFATGWKSPKQPRLQVRGARVRMFVDWSDLGGPRPFSWNASVAWTRTAGGTNNYAFDSIPAEGFARYPGD